MLQDSFFITNQKFQKLPQVKLSKTTLSGFFLVINEGLSHDWYEAAKSLDEQMSIVDESRNLTSEGFSITWEEFKKQHGKRGKTR